jgi:hypothetical protein
LYQVVRTGNPDQRIEVPYGPINADAWEKVFFIAGDEFGASRKGQVVLIVKALYGLKTSGAAWRVGGFCKS